ncbi:MAG: LacI family DNA-binding transcriptional regulator [Clostridia bacterium]|nr:LacI family DNA-binding transcriptional regulator [Clostridia bacterium]
MKKDAPTLKTVAQLTGFTTNTVSLALRDSPRVAKQTKEKIIAIAQQVGYVQNAIAGSLRSGRTNTCALVMGDIANPLFAIKIKAMEREFRKLGYQIMIFNTDEDAKQELDAVYTAISRKADGIVLCPCQKDEDALNLIRQYDMPCVLSGRYTEPQLEDAVIWDDRKGGYLAAKHLISRGCRKIAWLGVTQRISSARDRKLGYLEALGEAGIAPDPEWVVETSPIAGDIEDMVMKLMASGVDGICAFSDLIAWEIICCLEKKGIKVPQSVRLTGFDDAQKYMHIPYRLTSISADVNAEAVEVARLLSLRMSQRDRPISICRMDTSLMEGASSL